MTEYEAVEVIFDAIDPAVLFVDQQDLGVVEVNNLRRVKLNDIRLVPCGEE